MRTSLKTLEAISGWINKETGSPETPRTRTSNGSTANVGNYHLSQAYGGVCLHRMSNEAGGVVDIFSCGHIPKRELEDRMRAYYEGLMQANGKRG